MHGTGSRQLELASGLAGCLGAEPLGSWPGKMWRLILC